MSAEPVSDLPELVGAAMKVADESAGSLDHYLRWNFKRLINELYPDDFTSKELMACNAVFAQVLSRKLAVSDTTIRRSLIVGTSPLRAQVLRLVLPAN
jgi:hypothetical protein